MFLLKYLKYLPVFFVFSLVVFAAVFKITDPDTVQYLASGKYLLSHGFGHECVFNYSSQTCQIAFSEGLFHVITYIVYLIGEWNGLVFFQVLIVFSIFLVIFLYNKKEGRSVFSTTFFILFSALVAMERFMLRADLFSLLLAALFFWVIKTFLEKSFSQGKEKNNNYLFILLVLLQILWANTHGSFPLGFGIVFAFLFAEILKNLWQKYVLGIRTMIFTKKVKTLAFLFILCILASALNPFGTKAFLWPFKFFAGSSEFYSQLEFKSPFLPSDFQRLSVVMYKFLGLTTLILLILNLGKIKLADLFILGAFFFLSAKFVRNIGLFAVFSAIIMPFYLDNVILKLNETIAKKYIFGKKSRQACQIVLTILLVLFIGKFNYNLATNNFYVKDQRSRRFGFGISEIAYPQKAADFIEENNIQGNMFNDYGTGTYINWRLFPGRQSFIDGHSYTLDLLNYYNKVVSGQISYQEAVAKYQISYFFLNYTNDDSSKIIKQLFKDQNWALVYFDENSVIFLSNVPENQEIIDKYAIDFQSNNNFNQEELKMIKEKTNCSWGRTERGVFLSDIGLLDKAEYEFQKAVEANPKNYVALNNLGGVYSQLSKDDLALDAYKKSLVLQNRYAPTHFNLGLVLNKKNRADQALKEFQKTLKINSRYLWAHYNLGLIYEAKKESSKARKEYEAELKLNPGATAAQNALNRINNYSSSSGNAVKSIEELQKLVAEKPDDPDLHFQLGVAYGLQEEHNKAIEEFLKATELNPKMALAHFNLANIYSLKGRIEEAKEEYEKTIELDPKTADAYLNLGIIYRYKLDDKNKSVENWQKYLELEPDSPQAETIQQEIYRIVKEETGK